MSTSRRACNPQQALSSPFLLVTGASNTHTHTYTGVGEWRVTTGTRGLRLWEEAEAAKEKTWTWM